MKVPFHIKRLFNMYNQQLLSYQNMYKLNKFNLT